MAHTIPNSKKSSQAIGRARWLRFSRIGTWCTYRRCRWHFKSQSQCSKNHGQSQLWWIDSLKLFQFDSLCKSAPKKGENGRSHCGHNWWVQLWYHEGILPSPTNRLYGTEWIGQINSVSAKASFVLRALLEGETGKGKHKQKIYIYTDIFCKRVNKII